MALTLQILLKNTLIYSICFVTTSLLSNQSMAQPGCDEGIQKARKSRDLVLYSDINETRVLNIYKKNDIPDELLVIECNGVWRKIQWDKTYAWINMYGIQQQLKVNIHDSRYSSTPGRGIK